MPSSFPPSDPWARANAWRKHPIFNRTVMLRSAFPGFTLGVSAFAVYVAYDTFLGNHKKVDHH